MKTHKKTLWTIVIVVLIVVAAILKVVHARRTEAKLPVPKDYSIVVSAITPKLSHSVLTLPYLALTQNDKDVKLSSRISGRVNFILPSGSKVSKGDVIARIDYT
jgi:multidrug efflux pump subunit AcrA (membrane-fusion protein)